MPIIVKDYHGELLDTVRKLSRSERWFLSPMYLGGVSGPTGGSGLPAGGIYGMLIQSKVTYDTSESAYTDIQTELPSGSLVDNLAHIRAHINALAVSGVGIGQITIKEDNTIVSDKVTIVNFEGLADVTNDGGGQVTVDIIRRGIAVKQLDVPIADDVTTVNFKGSVEVTDDGNKQVSVNVVGGGGGSGGGYQTLTISGGYVDWNLANGNGRLYLNSRVGMRNPTGMVAGNEYWLEIIQAPSGHTISGWGSVYYWPNAARPSLSTTTLSGIDVIKFLCTGFRMYGYHTTRNLSNVFSPRSFDGLVMWYAARFITGLNDGDLVGTLLDRSGNNFTRTRIDEWKPIYKTNIVNGQPVLRGDGNRTIDTASISLNIGTVIAVVGNVANGANAPSVDHVYTTGNRRIITFFPNNITIYAGPDFIGPSPIPTWVDGVPTYNTQNTNFHIIMQDPTLGAPVPVTNSVMKLLEGNQALNGDIAEVIYYNRLLSKDEKNSLLVYLGDLYAINITPIE